MAHDITEIDMGPSVSWIRLHGQWVEIADGNFYDNWPSARSLDANETERAETAAEWL